MKKAGLCIILFAALLFIPFDINTSAETKSEYENAYSLIDSKNLNDFLDKSKADYYDINQIDIKDKNWVNRITLGNAFEEILKTVKENSLKPIRVFFSLLSIILITAAFTGDEEKVGVGRTAVISAVSVVSLIILADLWALISSLVTAAKSVCGIASVFVPVFESALFLSGKITTAAATSGVLLGITQGLSLVSAEYIMPIMGGYLGIGIASLLTPFDFVRQLGKTIKKVSVILLSIVFSLFVGITGIQTTVNSASDNLAIKTTKFIVGTFVPLGGGKLSEAANTLYSSMSLIKSSLGVYAVLSIVLICLPVIITTLLFKLTFSLSLIIAESFSQNELGRLFSAVNDLLSVVLSLVLFFAGVFVFSIALAIGLSGGG